MKKNNKKAILMIAILLTVIFAVSGCASGFYRGIDFGMTPEEVKTVESDLGEPEQVINETGIMYREIVQYNMGGDLLYLFDDDEKLSMIMFYAYPDYYTNEAVNTFMVQLSEEYPGYLAEDETIIVEDSMNAEWIVTDTDVTAEVIYESGQYFIVTFHLTDTQTEENDV